MKTLILSHQDLYNHGIDTHPENPYRLRAILDALQQSEHKKLLDVSRVRLATAEELALVHENAYINKVLSYEGKRIDLDDETPLSAGSVYAARLAVGLGLELVEQVVDGKCENGFALLRPPGHHAEPDRGMGYCVFNSIAIAAKYALSKGVKRILILDWDVHHGNGTQKAFYRDDRVLFIDLHQDNLFPIGSGTLAEIGAGRGEGFTVNLPLPASCKDGDYLYIFDTIIIPVVLKFRPELILVSCGFDAHESDPHGTMELTHQGYAMLCSRVKKLARELSGGKLVLFLEGGYDAFHLAKNVLACLGVLSNDIERHEHSCGIQPYVQQLYDFHVKHRC